MTITEVPVAVPEAPFRGIHPFRYLDHPIFFAREEETRRLVSLISVYRGVMLYGDSGAGKSSLINAGLIAGALEMGFTPERLRVQPRPAQELVLERIPISETSDEWLPSALASDEPGRARRVFSLDEFAERVARAAEDHRILLIFDQFEELITLFDEANAGEEQQCVVALLGNLLRGPVPVKILFSFREDYLGRVKELLSAAPELVDQALRLAPPSEGELRAIISGPFERYPSHYGSRAFPYALVDQLVFDLSERFQSGEVSLSEVQIVCLRLWQSDEAKRRLAMRGVGGLLEDYLGDELSQLPIQLQPVAVALLSQMVTSAGTRNVVSAEDLAQRMAQDGEHFSREQLGETLTRLSEARLVRSERRRDLYLYELASEFLVPWISQRRDKLREDRKRHGDLKRLRTLSGIIVALLAVVVAMVAVVIWALGQQSERQSEAALANAVGLASNAKDDLGSRLDVSLFLSLAALAPYDTYWSAPPLAREAMLRSVTSARSVGMLGILDGGSDGVNDLELTRDGRTAVTASADGTVRLWDLVTRREIGAPLRGHTDAVWSAVFSPDGSTVASAGDSTIRLWDARTGKPLGVLHDPNLVFGVAFSPNGRYIAGADGAGIQIWDAQTHRRVTRFGPAGGMSTVAFSPHGDIVAGIPLASSSATMAWAFPSGRQLGGIPGAAEEFKFRPQGDAVAVVTGGHIIEHWSPGHAPSVTRIAATGTKVSTIAYSGNGQFLVGGCSDGSIRVWNAVTGQLVTTEEGPAGAGITNVAVGKDDTTIVSSSGGTTILLSSAAAGGPAAAKVSLTSPPSATTLPAGMSGQALSAFATTASTIRSFPAPRSGSSSGSGTSASAAVSADGRVLAFNAGGPNTELWDLRSGRLLTPIALPPNQYVIADYAFSPVGSLVGITYVDGPTEIWNYKTHTRLETLPTSARYIDALAFSPDGSLVATADDSGTVKIWGMHDKQPIAVRMLGDHTGIYTLGFSPAGDTVGFVSGGGIGFWNFRRNQLPQSIPVTVSGNASVSSLAFSEDGRTLATGMSDGTVDLWDVATRKQIDVLSIGHNSNVGSVAFWPDSSSIIAGADDGTIRSWPNLFWRSYPQLKSEVCGLVGAGLTHAEWRQYASGFNYSDPCR